MITIYESSANDFTTLGLGILDPTECEIEEEAGGMYELTLVHPMDDGGRHKLLKPGRIIKSPAPVRENPEITLPGSTPTVMTYPVWRSITNSRLFIRQTVNGTKIGSIKPGEEVLRMAVDTSTGSTWFKICTLDGGTVGYVFPNLQDVYELPYMEDTGRTQRVTTGKDTPGGTVKVELSKTQLFRIYSVERKSDTRSIEVHAQHITYDLMGVVWTHGSSGYDIPIGQLLTHLRSTSYVDHDAGIALTTYASGNWYVTSAQYGRNAMNILLDSSNGAITQVGGRLLRDNFNLYILPKSDRDLGFQIRYGKNLLQAALKSDITGVITRVIPLGKTAGGGPLWGNTQDSPHRSEYGTIASVKKYDVQAASESTSDVNAAKARLIELGQQEFTRKHIDQPTISLDAEFVQLEHAPEYAEYANSEKLHMYDRARVYDPAAGISATVEMVGYKFDALLGKYTAAKLGGVLQVDSEEHQIVYLTYLQSDGTAYVDTSVKANLNTEVQLDMAMVSTSNANVIAMGDISDTSAALSINNKYSGSGSPTSRFGSKTVQYSGTMETGTRYLYTVNKTAYIAKKVVSGAQVTVGTFGQTAAFESAQSMYIFVGRTASGISSYTGTIRVYGCKIYDSGVLQHDFRPALYDDVPCLYDTITQTPHYNVGSGDFTYTLPNLMMSGYPAGYEYVDPANQAVERSDLE